MQVGDCLYLMALVKFLKLTYVTSEPDDLCQRGSNLHVYNFGETNIRRCCKSVPCKSGQEPVICPSEGSSAVCKPCDEGTFQQHTFSSSSMRPCERYQKCLDEEGKTVWTEGTDLKDRVCACDWRNGKESSGVNRTNPVLCRKSTCAGVQCRLKGVEGEPDTIYCTLLIHRSPSGYCSGSVSTSLSLLSSLLPTSPSSRGMSVHSVTFITTTYFHDTQSTRDPARPSSPERHPTVGPDVHPNSAYSETPKTDHTILIVGLLVGVITLFVVIIGVVLLVKLTTSPARRSKGGQICQRHPCIECNTADSRASSSLISDSSRESSTGNEVEDIEIVLEGQSLNDGGRDVSGSAEGEDCIEIVPERQESVGSTTSPPVIYYFGFMEVNYCNIASDRVASTSDPLTSPLPVH